MAVEGQDVKGVPVVGHGEVRTAFRPSEERPIHKLSVRLIDTYKHINRVYYEARAKKTKEVNDANRRGGIYNDGYDDQQYDYILLNEEVFADRYILKHRIGKGSFGQVVCAYDQKTSTEVAIKIIKSRRPFMVQAQTEIALLEHVDSADPGGDYNAVKMINKFVFRNHQCLVFEMLSYNLYELLKNTKYVPLSLLF
jgi:dual specificity tyrosine-phosphorylation-regulated kinase 1